MTYQSSSAEAYVPPQANFAPPAPTPLPQLESAPAARLGPPGLGLIVVALGWAAIAAATLVVGGLVFVGILQAAFGG